MPADEPSAAEVLLEWAERVVDAEDDVVLGEREAQLQDDLVAHTVKTMLLARELEQGGLERLTPGQRRYLARWATAQIEQLEQLIARLPDLNEKDTPDA